VAQAVRLHRRVATLSILSHHLVLTTLEVKMDWQQIINFALSAFLGVIGWFARQLWEAVQKLKEDVNSLELHVSENYAKKSDINNLKTDLNARFDRIEQLIDKVCDKLDQKADR
jgi:cell division protein FtsB